MYIGGGGTHKFSTLFYWTSLTVFAADQTVWHRPANEWLHILIGAVMWRRAQGLDTRDKAEQKAQIWGHQLTAWSSFYVTA